MNLVDRLDDPGLAAYAHVADHAWLESHGLFVAEGRLVVRRLIEAGRFGIHSVLLTPPAHAALADVLSGVDGPIHVCSQQALKTLTGFNFHRGCVALARREAAPVPIARLLCLRTVVGLEAVGNPDNIGGVFRNALALGAEGVLLDPTSGDPLYRKAIRTSMAAALRVPFARVEPWPAGLQAFREAGFTIVALTPSADATDIGSVASSRAAGRLLLLAGHEGQGLSAGAIAASDLRWRIPMDPRSDSLNVSVAVGIALAMLRAGSVDARG